MAYTEIQIKYSKKYYYRCKSIREGELFRKIRKYMGVELSKEELEKKEKEMDILLDDLFKGVLKSEGISKSREKLYQEIENLTPLKKETEHIPIANTKLAGFPTTTVKAITDQYNKAFHSKVFTLIASSESELYTFAKRHKPHYKYCFAFVKNDEGQWYMGIKEMNEVRAGVVKQAKKDPTHVIDLYKTWENDWRNYLALADRLKKLNFAKYNNMELYQTFKEFYQQYQLVGSIAYISDSFMSTGEEDWLEKLILNELKNIGVPPSGTIHILRKLTSPVHLSFTLESDYQLLKIAEKVLKRFQNKLPAFEQLKEQASLLYGELKKHEETFYWIQNNYYNVHYIDAEEFYNQIIGLIKETRKGKDNIERIIKEKEKELENTRRERENLINQLSLPSFIKNILQIARLFGKWKDKRKSGVYIGMHFFDLFFDEISKRTEFTKTQLTFTVFEEIEDILFDKVDKKKMHEEIAERKIQCFFAFTQHGYYIVGGKKAETYFKLINKKEHGNVMEIRGVIASPGYARGRVCIIKKTDDIKNFRTGDILVANQTTPEFLPAMRKSAAIVTEQGGITSHAAMSQEN